MLSCNMFQSPTQHLTKVSIYGLTMKALLLLVILFDSTVHRIRLFKKVNTVKYAEQDREALK